MFVLKLLWTLIAIAIPLLGTWVVSSLTASANGPVWLAVLAGFLLFPILPLLWDALALSRHRKKSGKPPRLKPGTRIMLRTAVLNVVVLGAVLAAWPAAVFTALSTRGDWMLEGRSGVVVEDLREGLFFAADRLEWLYLAAKKNAFEEVVAQEELAVEGGSAERAADAGAAEAEIADAGVPAAAEVSDAGAAPEPSALDAGVHDAGAAEVSLDAGIIDAAIADAAPSESSERAVLADSAEIAWPLAGTPHPLIHQIPESEEREPRTIARYFKEHEADEVSRLKAIHDYVADRIAYDAESYFAGRYPPQDAATVLKTRLGVCAGYSALFKAIAEEAGYEVATVVGSSRGSADAQQPDEDDAGGSGHAWSAVKLHGRWYLTDVTWDAGHIGKSNTFEKSYRSEYFLTPPEIFILTHFPRKPKWQLLEQEITRGEFMRQPTLRPQFFAAKLRMISPERSQMSVDKNEAELVIDNPADQSLLASFSSKADPAAPDQRCRVEYTRTEAHVRCRLPASGVYGVRLFASMDPLAAHDFVGEVEVAARF